MTDEMLDRLKSLADKIVLRDGDVEIAVIPLLLAEIDRLNAAAWDSRDHYADARAEIDRLTRILAALREPSEAVLSIVRLADKIGAGCDVQIPAAVAAAEQEVGP